MNSLLGAVFLLGIIFVETGECGNPVFGQGSYHLTGTLRLPYAHVNEPISVWVQSGANGEKSIQRIDFYDGLNSYFYLQDKLVEIVPTDYNISCLYTDEDGYQGIQTFFPDTSKFERAGVEIIRGHQCIHLQMIEDIEGKTNTYNFYYFENENGEAVPVEFHFLGYNILGGSHYDEYIFQYDVYEEGKIDGYVWHKAEEFTCQRMPGTSGPSSGELSSYFDGTHSQFVDKQFDSFKENHGKKYKDQEEHNKRKDIFRNNLRFVHSANRGRGGSMKLSINHLADLSEEEMRSRRPLKGMYKVVEAPFVHRAPVHLDDLPNSFDWRPTGAVSPPKDQGNCGSCWSFGSSEAIEGQVFVQTGKMTRLSAQSLIDCSWKYQNNGCDGGLDFQAYQFVIDNGGIATEESYPYTMADGLCHIEDSQKVSPIVSWAAVATRDPVALKHALVTKGPISIALDASLRSMSFYSSGVYYDAKCQHSVDSLDHAVLLVGYGVENGQEYWLVKNSWSEYWGDRGYIKISMNKDCGVTTQPTYVIPRNVRANYPIDLPKDPAADMRAAVA